MARCVLCTNPKGWPVIVRGTKLALCFGCIESDALHRPENTTKLLGLTGPAVVPVEKPKMRRKRGPNKKKTVPGSDQAAS